VVPVDYFLPNSEWGASFEQKNEAWEDARWQLSIQDTWIWWKNRLGVEVF
jgi:hypothetical protein